MRTVLAMVVVGLLCHEAGASDRISFRVSVVPAEGGGEAQAPATVKVRRGQVVKMVVKADLQPGFHTYPLTVRTARQSDDELWMLRATPPKGLAPLWPIVETEPVQVDVVEKRVKLTKLEHRKSFTWVQELVVLPEAEPGDLVLPMKLRGMVCYEGNCQPIRQEVKASLVVSAETALPLTDKLTARIKEPKPVPTVVTIKGQEALPVRPEQERTVGSTPNKQGILHPIGISAEQYEQDMERLGSVIRNSVAATHGGAGDLWSFILAGIFWGAISLVTPCVFPMIPITVSFFLHQSEKAHHRPMTMALVYSGTIVVVLTLAAAFLLSAFRWLSVNPLMNYGLGALFIFFALSLFGMYDIELPSGLARFTSSHEGQRGLVGTMFMALTFTIISFACVAPFLGGFGGAAAGMARPLWHNLVGGLAFSMTFAAPFFLLALFPALLRRMPKSGSWLNSVKVVMGFLELAAAFKFFRSAELVLTGSDPWLFTFDFVLGIYVVLCALAGLYLLGVYRLPHDAAQDQLGVPRLLFAGLFLVLGVYLAPALFKDAHGDNLRPRGTLYGWVDSFLLPDATAKEDPHTGDLAAAVLESRAHLQQTGQTRRIFVDFTGVACTNCKINERGVFSRPSVNELFEPYLIVKLFTDTVPAQYYAAGVRRTFGNSKERQRNDADVNLAFQKKSFANEQLPLYVILEPQANDTIKVVGVYDEGRINDETAFAEFLRNPG